MFHSFILRPGLWAHGRIVGTPCARKQRFGHYLVGVEMPFPRWGGPPGKVPVGFLLKSTRPRCARFCLSSIPREARQKKPTSGALACAGILVPADVCDSTTTPKARTKNVFHESSESQSAFFGIPPATGYLCGPLFEIIAWADHGNAAVPGRQSTRLGSRSGANGAKSKVFLNFAPPPHQTTKPSRGWLWVVVRELLWFCLS